MLFKLFHIFIVEGIKESVVEDSLQKGLCSYFVMHRLLLTDHSSLMVQLRNPNSHVIILKYLLTPMTVFIANQIAAFKMYLN